MLLREVKHRYKNAVTTIQAIATQTFHQADKGAHQAFSARLGALAKALDLLTTRDWERVSMDEIVRRTLAPFEHQDRFEISGPEASLSADNSLVLALALHELATNAVKYGALSNGAGQVHLSWDIVEADQRRVRICWRETGGPPVSPPQRTGFGMVLIERALGGAQRGTSIDFASEGLTCVFEIPL
ncbi:MAG: sensor histidine kinase [Hyphomonadaceae bacterium]